MQDRLGNPWRPQRQHERADSFTVTGLNPYGSPGQGEESGVPEISLDALEMVGTGETGSPEAGPSVARGRIRQNRDRPEQVDLSAFVPSPLSLVSRRSHQQSALLHRLAPCIPPLVERYLSAIHPLGPHVDRDGLQTRLAQAEHLFDANFAALVLSIIALPFVLPGHSPSAQREADKIMAAAGALHHGTFHAHRELDWKPDTIALATAMHISSYSRARDDGATYIRQRHTTGLIELLKLDRPEGYVTLTGAERELALRLTWIAGAGERSSALLTNAPLAIRQRTSQLSGLLPASAAVGGTDALSRCLLPGARLYDCLGAPLIDCITGRCECTAVQADQGAHLPQASRGDINALGYAVAPHLLPEAIIATHAALDAIDLNAILSLVQYADAVLTREFLHVKVWQGCVSHSMLELTPVPSHPGLGFGYPLERICEVERVLGVLPRQAVAGNGRAMVRPTDQLSRSPSRLHKSRL